MTYEFGGGDLCRNTKQLCLETVKPLSACVAVSAQTVAPRLCDKLGWKEESLELGVFAQHQGRFTTPISSGEPTNQLLVVTGNGNTTACRNQKQAHYQQRDTNPKIMTVPQHAVYGVCIRVVTPARGSCSTRDVTPRLGRA